MRTPSEVLQSMRNQGARVVPMMTGSAQGQASKESGFLPLAGISSALTLFCNESGDYVTYQSDQYGFRNPARPHGRGRRSMPRS